MKRPPQVASQRAYSLEITIGRHLHVGRVKPEGHVQLLKVE